MTIEIVYMFLYFSLFYGIDELLTHCRFEGVYYAVHALHNAMITATTAQEVWLTLTDFPAAQLSATNTFAIQICFALHIYHIAKYYKKFRLDDWLHHGLMIGIALPVGTMLSGGTLLGYSLFFTTGLPGGIDYTLLFLTRNNWISRTIEKRINSELNVWIRSPGCVSLAAFVCVSNSMSNNTTIEKFGAAATALLNYWNGQYFMRQVVMNAITEGRG
jgi:hypothetical protein